MLKKMPRNGNGKQRRVTRTAKNRRPSANCRRSTTSPTPATSSLTPPRMPKRTTISSSTSTPMSPRRRSGPKSSIAWTATSTSRWRAPSRSAAPPPGLLNATPGMLYQDVFGRIPHQQRLGEAVPGGRTHAQVTLVQRAMDSMGIDYMVVFPTPMLVLGMHPQIEMEVVIGNAFNKWLTEEILPQDPRIKAMLYLPFNHPEACVEGGRDLRQYAGRHRLFGHLDAVPRRQSRQLHAALRRHPGDRKAARRSIPASTGATSRCSSATASSPCTRSRSSITTSFT